MTDATYNPDDYCYRHPDRLSFVLCERCGRTICLECQNHVNGKVLCPDDARRDNVVMMPVNAKPKPQPRVRRTPQLPLAFHGHPVLTYAILIVVVLVFVVDAISGGLVIPKLVVLPNGSQTVDGISDVAHQPWSLVTAMFVASGIGGLILGLFSIYSLGFLVERGIGIRGMALAYGVSGFVAASVAFLLDGPSLSAYSAILGTSIVAAVLRKRLRVNAVLLYISIALNFFLGIYLGGWQAAIGGAIGGLGIGFLYLYGEDNRKRARLIVVILVAFTVLVLAGAIVRAVASTAPLSGVVSTNIT